MRIQRIAADLGITDAAIHYHFGTREALMDALLRRIGRRLVDDIEATIEGWAPDQIDVAALGRLFQRAYADERVMPADRLVKLPDGIDDRTAATLMLKGFTVQYLFRQTYRLQGGETILFHAAAGGVGSIACQWARALGVTMIGTVGDGRFDVEVWRAAQRVIATRQSHLQRFRLAAASSGKQVRPHDVVEILT